MQTIGIRYVRQRVCYVVLYEQPMIFVDNGLYYLLYTVNDVTLDNNLEKSSFMKNGCIPYR